MPPLKLPSFLSCPSVPNYSILEFIDTIMKQLATTSLMGLLALLQPTIAAPRHLMKPFHANSCVSNGFLYHSGTSYLMSGNSYTIHCGRDSTSPPFSSVEMASGGFSACSESCGFAFECGGFSWIGSVESGICHLKNGFGGLAGAAGDAVTGFLDPDGNGIEPEPWSEGGPGPWSEPEPATQTASVPDPVASSYVPAASSPASSPASVASSYGSVASSHTPDTMGTSSLAPIVSTLSPSLPAYTSPLASATPTTPILGQCQQTVKNSGNIYRGGNGSPYELECGEDHYGGDLAAAGSATFLGCIDICNANPECIGYSYLGGVCYLKKYLNTANTNPAVNFALNLDRNSTAKPPSSSTSVAVTSPTATPAAAPGSCGYIAKDGAKTYRDSDHAEYTIQCGTDHNGGDIGAVGAKDFVGCMDACDKKDKCIAFSWVGGNGPGTCYLKGTVTDTESDVYVDYAYKKTPTDLPPPSSTSAASYGGESTSAIVVSSPAPAEPATSAAPTSYASVPTAPSYATSDSDTSVVEIVTVTSYTGSATPSSSSKQQIVYPQPNTRFPWPLWPNPTKLPPTKSKQRHPNTLPTPNPPDVPPPNLPGWPLEIPPRGPPRVPFGRPPWNPIGVPPPIPDFNHPPNRPFGVPPPNPPNGPPFDPYDPNGPPPFNPFGKPPFFPPNVRRSVPEEPTKTFTKKPLAPTAVGDSEYCDELREQTPMKLRCEVLEGDHKFDNMWIKDPIRSQY